LLAGVVVDADRLAGDGVGLHSATTLLARSLRWGGVEDADEVIVEVKVRAASRLSPDHSTSSY
jgi:hypothetical protein